MNPALLVSGHTLVQEGAAFTRPRFGGSVLCSSCVVTLQTSTGHGLCSCGAASPHLFTNSARKQWHREHKTKIAGAAA